MQQQTCRAFSLLVALAGPASGCGGELAPDTAPPDDGGSDATVFVDASGMDGMLTEHAETDGPRVDALVETGSDARADVVGADAGPSLHDACTGATSGLVTLATGDPASSPQLFALAVTNDAVFWSGAGSIWKASLDGCNAEVFSPGGVGSIAIGGTALYSADSNANSLFGAPLSGGPASVLAHPIMALDVRDGPQWVTTDGVNVYWTWVAAADAGGGIWEWQPADGGTARPLATGFAWPNAIASDHANLYWVNTYGVGSQGVFGTVASMPLGGGAVRILATGQKGPYAVTSDGVSVYWANTDGTVMKTSVDGTGTPVLLAQGPLNALAIATDGAFVYWTSRGDDPGTAQAYDGAIMKVPVAGGTATTLAASHNVPVQIAVDSTSVYWTEAGGVPTSTGDLSVGRVMKLTPK